MTPMFPFSIQPTLNQLPELGFSVWEVTMRISPLSVMDAWLFGKGMAAHTGGPLVKFKLLVPVHI